MSSPILRGMMIAVVAIVTAACFYAVFPYPAAVPDAVHYDRLGWNLARGRGFSLDEAAPFAPTMFREPAYPFFLSLIYRLTGHSPFAVVVAQFFLHAFTAVIVCLLGRDLFGEAAGWWAGMITAVFPTLATMAGYVLSETFFTFLLCGAAAAYYYGAVRGAGVGMFLLSGILFGFLGLTKGVAVPLPAILALSTAVLVIAGVARIRRPWLSLILFILVPALMVGGWLARNKTLFGSTAIALRGGQALWSRAAKLDDPPREVAASACYGFSEYLGNRLFPGMAARPERYLFKDFDASEEKRTFLHADGMTDAEIEAVFTREALGAIARRPGRYLLYTPVEWIKMTAFTYVPLLNEPAIQERFTEWPQGRKALAAVRGLFRLAAYPLLVLCVAGMVRARHLWPRWIYIAFIIGYLNGIYALLDAIGRYAVPLIPLYCLFAAAAVFPGKQFSCSEKG